MVACIPTTDCDWKHGQRISWVCLLLFLQSSGVWGSLRPWVSVAQSQAWLRKANMYIQDGFWAYTLRLVVEGPHGVYHLAPLPVLKVARLRDTWWWEIDMWTSVGQRFICFTQLEKPTPKSVKRPIGLESAKATSPPDKINPTRSYRCRMSLWVLLPRLPPAAE